MVVDLKLDPEDYRQLKLETTHEIARLEARLSLEAPTAKNVDGLLEKAVGNLSHLDVLYGQGTMMQKRQIIGSIYPEKLTFDGNSYRTTRINQTVQLIYTLDKDLEEIKNRKASEILQLSGGVAPRVENSNLLLQDLRDLCPLLGISG